MNLFNPFDHLLIIGHTNCVRSLVALNDNEFLSCSNDDTIKRWNINSVRYLQTYQGHTSFVYSISLISSDRFASVGEDRTLRIWSLAESEAKQTIRLPSTSIWSVCSLTNGDVAAGCRFVIVKLIEKEMIIIFLVMDECLFLPKIHHEQRHNKK